MRKSILIIVLCMFSFTGCDDTAEPAIDDPEVESNDSDSGTDSEALPTTGGELHVNSFMADAQEHPRVAMADDGRFATIWMSRNQAADDNTAELFGQVMEKDGTLVGDDFQITDIAASATFYGPNNYDIAMAADGSFVVAYAGYGSDNRAVYAQLFSADGTPGGSAITVDETTDSWNEYSVSVAMANGGDFAVLFDWEAGFNTGAKMRLYNKDGSPVADAFWVTNQRRVYDQDLAADDSGNYVAVWRYYDMDTEVFAQLVNSDGALNGGEIPVNTSTEDAQEKPSVGMAGSGDFVVVWESSHLADTGGASIGIWGQRFSADGSKDGSEFQVSPGTTGSAEQADAKMAYDGSFVVSWGGEGGPQNLADNADWSEVWVRRFAADGSPIDSGAMVNTFTDFKQEDARMAMNASGEYVVVWSDHEQEQDLLPGADDNYIGIYARFFQ